MSTEWIRKAEMDMERVRKYAEQARDRIRAEHASWPKGDARGWALARFTEILFVPVLGLCLLRTNLNDLSWWENYSPGYAEAIAHDGRKAIDRFLKQKLILDLAANVEHPFRILLRQLDPSNGASNFQSIYKSLLRQNVSYLANVPPGSENTLEFLRLIRNTVHNDWIHHPESGQNAAITFQGQSYTFIVGKALNFLGWDLMVALSEEVLKVVEAVMRDGHVATLPSIRDIAADAF